MEKFKQTKLATWNLPIKKQIQHYIDIAKESGHKLSREEEENMYQQIT